MTEGVFFVSFMYLMCQPQHQTTTAMKLSCFFLLASCFISTTAQAQRVYSVNYANQADVKVFVVKYESQADLKVFKVDYSNQAGNNDGKWFFTDYANQAQKKIFYVDYENQADVKIFFVRYASQAGWQNSNKRHFFY